MLLPPASVNHNAPSGPAVIAWEALFGVGMMNSVTVPPVVMRPILFPPISVNHRALSGPAAMPPGLPAAANLVTVPSGLIRPMLPLVSVNQKAPSGPAVIVNGVLAGVGKSVTATIDISLGCELGGLPVRVYQRAPISSR